MIALQHSRPTRAAIRRPTGLAVALLCVASFAVACAHPGPSTPLDSAQEGMASFYAAKFSGRTTASGEKYDPQQLTAAHRTLPFGSLVRVERLGRHGMETGSSVEVRINDRGPFVNGRVIDLSDAAARKLDMKRDGVVPVRVRVLELP